MTVRFRLPDLGEGVAETEIIRWLVQPGEEVAEDQPMVEVMTDKATVEIPSPATGTVSAVHAAEGEVVPVGSVIVEIAGEGVGEGGPAEAPEHRPVTDRGEARATRARRRARGEGGEAAAAGPRGRVQATPLVRRLAEGLGVDLTVVEGTGPKGRITDEDVRRVAAGGEGGVVPGLGVPAEAAATGAGAAGDQAPPEEGVRKRIALRGMRRAIADHLTRSQQVPTVTVVEECELTTVDERRREDVLGYVPYVIEAVLAGFDAVPEMNAVLDGQRHELVLYDRVDIGVAVQTDAGLLVPVVRDCRGKSLEQVDREVNELADSARAGTLTPEQLRGGTFTVTSAGKFGGLFTTPLLNAPEVGILGLHRADDRPVVRDGEVVVRRMANLSVTFDHRALDGIAASRFLLAVIERLQRR